MHMDDILILGYDDTSHLKNLQKVFIAMDKAVEEA